MKGLFLLWLEAACFSSPHIFKEPKSLQIDMIPEKICTATVSQRDRIFHNETA